MAIVERFNCNHNNFNDNNNNNDDDDDDDDDVNSNIYNNTDGFYSDPVTKSFF